MAVLTGTDAGAVDAAIGSWLAEQARLRHATAAVEAPTAARAPDADGADGALLAVAVDGKTVRGAVAAGGAPVHLLAAATHGDQLVLGQVVDRRGQRCGRATST